MVSIIFKEWKWSNYQENRVFVDSSGRKKTFQMSKYTKICWSHFEYGRPVETAPYPTLFLKGYGDNVKVGIERKARTSSKESPARTETLRKKPVVETKKS